MTVYLKNGCIEQKFGRKETDPLFGGKTPPEGRFLWVFCSHGTSLKKFLRFLVEMGSHELRCWTCTDNKRDTVPGREDETEVFLKDVMETKCPVSSEKKPADGAGSSEPSPVCKPVLDSAGRWTFITRSSPSHELLETQLFDSIH